MIVLADKPLPAIKGRRLMRSKRPPVVKQTFVCRFTIALKKNVRRMFALSNQTTKTIKTKVMETATKTKITIQASIKAPVEKVWNLWTSTADIVKWSTPSPDWHTVRATHDLKEGGNFNYRMEAKDGSFGFDFGGVFDVLKKNELIEYTIGDGRKVVIHFTTKGDITDVVQTFEAESENPVEMQRAGWQAILDSFKNYAENQ